MLEECPGMAETGRWHPHPRGFPDDRGYWVGKWDIVTLNVASLNVRGLRDPSKCAHLLGELSNFCVNVVAVQETHYTVGCLRAKNISCEKLFTFLSRIQRIMQTHGGSFSNSFSTCKGLQIQLSWSELRQYKFTDISNNAFRQEEYNTAE